MKRELIIIVLLSLGILLFACSEDDNVPYGPDYEIAGIKLDVDNSEYYRDTIPADVFKLKLTMLSDNDYAHQYGLNPNLTSKITDVQIMLGNHEGFPGIDSAEVNKYFVVDDGGSYDSLYETIEQYTSKEKIKSLTPYLLFTNQTSLAAKAGKLVTDTVAVQLKVQLTLDNKKTFSKQVSTVLIP
ncbi:MAG: hypothetical protein ACK5M7_04815 [Draconibacterium sp.]